MLLKQFIKDYMRVCIVRSPSYRCHIKTAEFSQKLEIVVCFPLVALLLYRNPLLLISSLSLYKRRFIRIIFSTLVLIKGKIGWPLLLDDVNLNICISLRIQSIQYLKLIPLSDLLDTLFNTRALPMSQLS